MNTNNIEDKKKKLRASVVLAIKNFLDDIDCHASEVELTIKIDRENGVNEDTFILIDVKVAL